MEEPTTRLRISLRDIKPKIWRRVEVPTVFTLAQLHEIIQITMSWWDYHLHEFEAGKTRFAPDDPEDDFDFAISEKPRDEATVTLADLMKLNFKKLTYVYDFGDWWVHDISIGVERTGSADINYPVFLDGENNSPPEDVGGCGGYEHYLAVISDPHHEEYEEMLEWRGEGFDWQFVDEETINARLGEIAARRKSR